MEMNVQEMDAVKQWVLQYVGEVEVVALEVLRKDVFREIQRMFVWNDR